MDIDRREVLKLVAGSSLAAFAPALARAQSVGTGPGYRAIVALFLYGGNDSNNMIVPTDGRHAAYAAARGTSLAIAQDRLNPLTGTAYGLHPALSAMNTLWDEGALSWSFNTGPLLQPLTRQQYEDRDDLRPANLFSHDAQQNLWQTSGGRSELPTGWLGRVGDGFVDSGLNAPSVSLAGAQRAMIGDRNQPLLISGSSLSLRGYDPDDTSQRGTSRRAAFEAMLNAGQSNALAHFTTEIMRGDFDRGAELNTILNGDGSVVDAAFTDPSGNGLTSGLATQLKRVARLIEGRDQIGATRQTFMVTTGGFDTHRNQVDGDPAGGFHAGLLGDIANCVYAFHNTMKVLGMADEVTLFSMSDFGRTFAGNGSRGSDHAWGGHHFAVGGGLRPNQLHGQYPDLALGGPDDARTNGRWIPQTSIDEYAAAMVRWLGVADADLPYVFPNWSTWNGGGRGPVPFFV